MNSVELYRQRYSLQESTPAILRVYSCDSRLHSLQVDTCSNVHVLSELPITRYLLLQYKKGNDYFGCIVVSYGYLGRDTFLKCIINGFICVISGK